MNIPAAAIPVSAFAFLSNIPLGYYRSTTEKFSWQWILAVHASVPFVIFFRKRLQLPNITIPLNVGLAVAGQMLGGYFGPKTITVNNDKDM